MLGEIYGDNGTIDATCTYLLKGTNGSDNAQTNGATGKTQAEMDEIMAMSSFVSLMNDYVRENNLDSTKPQLKLWTLSNGLPVFQN